MGSNVRVGSTPIFATINNIYIMLPYGKSAKMRYNYTDCHPKRLRKKFGDKWKYVNWWETELGGIDKGAERQHAKTEIRKELND